MTSFRFAPNSKARKVGRFITHVRRELQKAFMEEKETSGITQSELAKKLDVDRAVVCRQLAGSENMTFRTIAEYAWALDRDLVFGMPKKSLRPGANIFTPASGAPEPTFVQFKAIQEPYSQLGTSATISARFFVKR